MRTRVSSPLLLRGTVLVLWTIALVLTANLGPLVMPHGELAVYAWFQAISILCFAASFVLLCMSKRGIDLPLPCFLALASTGFQLASAWMLPTGYVSAFPGSASTRPAYTGPNPGTLSESAATALLSLVLVFDAVRRTTAPGQKVPLRARLRETWSAVTLDPFSLFFGPVFQREVRVMGRNRAPYWARALVPLILIAIVSFTYWGMTRDMRHYAGAQRLQELQQLAPVLAMTLAWCQFALLIFIAPVLTSSGICDERRARTLPALMTTPLTSAQIIAGKLSSRMVQVVILALAGAPLLLGVRIFGGLEARIIVATTAVTLSAAVLAAALGLMYSIWHRRAAPAAIFALLTLIAFTLVPVCILVAAELRSSGPTSPASLSWVFALSAPVAMFGITASIFAPGGMGLDLETIWIGNAAMNLGLATIVGLFSTAALRKVLRAEAAGALAQSRPVRRRKRRATRATDLSASDQSVRPAEGEPPHIESDTDSDESLVFSSATRHVGDLPVLWREVRQAAFGSRNKLIALGAVVTLGMGWLYWSVGLFGEGLHLYVAVLVILAVCIHAALTTTASIAGERESRTWDILLTTPLTPLEIVSGKLLGGLRRLWFILAVLAAHSAVCLAAGSIHILTVIHLFTIALAAAVLLNGTGLFFSMVIRRSSAAAVCNLSFALALWLGLPIAVSFFTALIGIYGGESKDVFSVLVAANPVAMAAIATADITPASLSYDMPHGRMGPTGFTVLLTFMAFLAIAAGLGAAMLAVSFFPKRSGRSS